MLPLWADINPADLIQATAAIAIALTFFVLHLLSPAGRV